MRTTLFDFKWPFRICSYPVAARFKRILSSVPYWDSGFESHLYMFAVFFLSCVDGAVWNGSVPPSKDTDAGNGRPWPALVILALLQGCTNCWLLSYDRQNCARIRLTLWVLWWKLFHVIIFSRKVLRWLMNFFGKFVLPYLTVSSEIVMLKSG